ncbi:MAG: DUF262 domain-containing protein [Acidiferrobacterales bacterium]|nr:DUF262 domain-containing protein [Acidiferrobacterales bacterium]
MDIQPQLLPLTKLLDGRLFSIPDYQRAYSWGSQHRADLFEDIENIFQNGKHESHFMATIVCLRRESKFPIGTDEYDKLDIVDGQQRLTTIVLLLNAIKLELKRCDQSYVERELREISELLVKESSDNLILLQTNQDSSFYFFNFIRYGTVVSVDQGKTLADRELLKAIEDCQEFLRNRRMDEQKLLELYSCIKNRLFFVLYEISEEKLVYTVFEVLNSRGIEVSWLDRLKCILMGKAYELPNSSEQLIPELHTIWRNIYKEIGLHQGLSSESLRFAATLYQSGKPSKPLSEPDAVAEFRDKAVDASSIRTAAQWLLNVTKACDKVFADSRRNAITKISQARLLVVAIHLRDDINEDDKEKLLILWEKTTFRIYGMLGKDARTQVGNYVRLSWRIKKENLSVKEIQSEIQSIGKGFPINDAVESLRNFNCYEGWGEELRYFMFRYEEYLAKKEGQDISKKQWELIWQKSTSESIEHIWPQSTAPEDIKHRIGNLMILPLGLNKQLQDNHPNQKFAAYERTGLYSATEVPPRTRRWSKKAVNNREQRLLEFARIEWGD